jgi:hypothetical protein
MARHVFLATVAAAAALAIWWGLQPGQVTQAEPAVQLEASHPRAQAATGREVQQRSTSAVLPAPAVHADAPSGGTAPLEHESGDEPGVQYALREDEGVLRRVPYQPEPMAMDNPFGAQAWGERRASAVR